MAVELHNLLEDLAVISSVEENTVRSKALAVQSLLEMTESRAKENWGDQGGGVFISPAPTLRVL